MVADSMCSRSRKAGMMNLFRSVASIRFDDLVRPFLVANDVTDAIVIAVDGLVHHANSCHRQTLCLAEHLGKDKGPQPWAANGLRCGPGNGA